MAMLKFKRGLYSQINEAALSNGTVYIATDEKAMYVDTATERIRIGDFIRVDTVKDITPPFSTSSLYYVESDNALLKYDGSAWKLVNGTDDLKASITSLQSDVSQVKSDITTLQSDVSGLKTTTGTHSTDIEALKAAVGMNEEGEVEGLAGTVAQLRTDLTALDGEVDDLANRVAANEGSIAKHTNDIAANAKAISDHAVSAEETYAKKTDVYTKTETYTKEEVDAAIDADVLVETNRAKAAEKTLTDSLAEVKNTADNAVSNATFDQFKTDNTTAINNAKSAAVTEAVEDANEYTDGKIAAEVTRANGAYAAKSVEDTVLGHTSTLNTLTGTGAGSVAEAKDRADAAYELADAAVTTDELTAATKDFATKTEAQGYADAKDESIKAAADAAAEAKAAADAAQETADKAVSDASAANANAETRLLKSDFETFKTSNTEAIANAEKAGTDAQDTANSALEKANANAAAITVLNGDASTDGSVAKAVADAKADLESTIAEEINAANAMNYVAGVQSAEDLPVNVPAGTTYVAEKALGTINGKNVLPGDLLIATGEEDTTLDDGTKVIAVPTWTVVSTGYDASLEQSITTTSDGKIQLTSAVGAANNGQIAFVAAEDSAATVAVADNTVTIGMEWEDFPAVEA